MTNTDFKTRTKQVEAVAEEVPTLNFGFEVSSPWTRTGCPARNGTTMRPSRFPPPACVAVKQDCYLGKRATPINDSPNCQASLHRPCRSRRFRIEVTLVPKEAHSHSISPLIGQNQDDPPPWPVHFLEDLDLLFQTFRFQWSWLAKQTRHNPPRIQTLEAGDPYRPQNPDKAGRDCTSWIWREELVTNTKNEFVIKIGKKTLTSTLTVGSDVKSLQTSLSTSLPSNFCGIFEEYVPVIVIRCNSRSEIW